MPDPEGKELAGLARSIDALFSDAGPRAEPGAGEVQGFGADAWVEAEPDLGLESFEHEEDRVSADWVEGGFDAFEDRPVSIEDGFDAVEEDLTSVEEGFDAVDVPVVHEADASIVSEEVHPEPRSDGLPMADASPLDSAVDAFLAGDRDQAAEIGRLAAEGLESLDLDPSERALVRLALAAGDPPEPGILAVVESIATTPVLARLVLRMGTERDEARRAEYFTACRTIGVPAAMAIRDDLAESTDRLARRINCEAMIEMGEVSRPVIEEMAADQNRFLVRNAVRMLGEVGGEAAVELVTNALWNPDARVRLEALRALARLGDADAGQVAAGLLDDSDPEVQIAAVVTAGELRTERALKTLTGMLDAEKDHERCLPLLHALGQIGDPGAVPSIEKHAVRSLLSKPRTDVRIAAYRALNQIGTPHARRLLNQAVSDKDPEVKAAVREILGMR